MKTHNLYTMTIKEKVEEKLDVLTEFDVITPEKGNRTKIKKMLFAEIEQHPNCDPQVVLDKKANQLIFDYLDDVQKEEDVALAKHYHMKLQKLYPNTKVIYEDIIREHFGCNGLIILRKSNLIKSCGIVNGKKLYAI